MVRCEHTAMLEMSGTSRLCLVNPGRLQDLTQCLNDPVTQYPSTLVFLGKQAKRAALRQLFPGNNATKRNNNQGLAQLYIDTFSANLEHPNFFVDCDPSFTIPAQQSAPKCHETKSFGTTWVVAAAAQATALIYSRLVFLFTDVICIFADDLGGLGVVCSYLLAWAGFGSASGLPCAIRPRIVVVTSSLNPAASQLEEENFFAILQQADLKGSFSSVVIQRLTPNISPNAQYRPLRESVLGNELDAMISAKKHERCLFSAAHVAAFYAQAVAHTARTMTEKFDFIQVSRVSNPVQEDYHERLSIFLQLAIKYKIPYDTLASVIGSSIVLDAFPPSSHHFDPRQVYRSLYASHCQTALQQEYTKSVLPFNKQQQLPFSEYLCDLICGHFARLSVTMGRGDAVSIHRENLKATSRFMHWSRVRSNRCCLFCLSRLPEHVLNCRHSMCDMCVQRFGEGRPALEYSFRVPHCVLCGRASDLIVNLKPPTAGIRILSVDGGGVRGIVPLEFLNLLQESLGTNCRVQDLFDLAFGTSAGGLIILGLFSKQWSVSYSIEVFRRLTSQFFGSSATFPAPTVARFRSYLRCLLSDSCYKAEGLETSLQESFGFTERLFDFPSRGTSQYKIAVTATTISDASPFIFTNYNGPYTRNKQCGYRHLRPKNTSDEPLLWEAGRATTAAPVLFRPVCIPSVGTFQDGGLKHNNPINIALWESRQIWPANTAVDVVLSLGTGTIQDANTPQASSVRDIISDGFIPRLCRSFLSSLDGEITWRDLSNHLGSDAKSGYFRLNIPLVGSEPRLDDIRCMDSLRHDVKSYKNDSKLLDIKLALLASCFFFELDAEPKFAGYGFYRCRGFVRIRGHSSHIFEVLKSIDHGRIEILKGNEAITDILELHGTCPICGRFCAPVQFYIRHPSESITLSLSIGHRKRHRISGFPQTMDWFVGQQKLHSPFCDLKISTRVCVCSTTEVIKPLVVRKRKHEVDPKGVVNGKSSKQQGGSSWI